MSASAFEELRNGFEGPFWALGGNSADDGETVVISWPSVPVEIVRAAGFKPVFARGHDSPTPVADGVLEPELFPNRLRQLVEAALTQRLRDVAAILLPRSSDPDYKCFLYLRELARRGVAKQLPPVLLFDLLHSPHADAEAYNADRARGLSAQLADLAGRTFRPDDLRGSIEGANRGRSAARRVHSQRRGTPRIAGTEALPLLGAFWQLEPARYASLANAAADSAARRTPLEGPRVLLAGAPVDGTRLHAAVEAAGAVVVAELSPFGGGGTSTDVESGDDPFAALAGHYRRESIDARLPVDSLLLRLQADLDAVDAVVVSLPSDDATFGWDYPRIRELLAARSIPHAVLAGEAALGEGPSDDDRITPLLRQARTHTEARSG